MRVVILGPTEDGGLELAIEEPLPNVPEWIAVYPEAEGRRFLTLPAGHRFEESRGDYGFPLRIRTAARRFLADEIDQATVEQEITATLAGWSRATE